MKPTMNKLIWIFGAIVVAIAIAGAVLVLNTQDAQESALETTRENAAQDAGGNASVGATGETVIVRYTDDGFSPSTLTIAPGTTVTWSNESSEPLWVMASGDTSSCPLGNNATALNECASIGSGGSFSHTFTTAGTISYINKEQSEDTGSVTVSEESSDVPPAGPLNTNVILQ